MKQTAIRACVFDAYGTLFNLDFPLAAYSGRLQGKEEEILAVWRQKQLTYTWLRGMMDRYRPFWEVTQDALRYALNTVGISDPGLAEEIARCYLTPRLFGDVMPTLAALRQTGIATAILSNGSPDMLAAGMAATQLKDHIDEVFSVDQVKTYKPSPTVYRIPCDFWQCAPQEVAFCSANAWDVAGAAHFGLKTFWVNRKSQPPEALGQPLVEQLPSLEGLAAAIQHRSTSI